LESVHYLLKQVAGVPSLRPAWFFDVRQQGEGLADVGTHLVDLVQWILFPEQALDSRRDLPLLRAKHWPTVLTLDQFQRVTGERVFPDSLSAAVRGGFLRYLANNNVNYVLRGIHVRLDVKWDFEAPPGAKDTELAVFRGTRSRVEVRQGMTEKYIPELYVVPNGEKQRAATKAALQRHLGSLQDAFPGLSIQEAKDRLQVRIPERLRASHEAHFSLLAGRFLECVGQRKPLPAWEQPNLIAKYSVTTKGVALAREANTEPSNRAQKP
jgi:hypothetical protein